MNERQARTSLAGGVLFGNSEDPLPHQAFAYFSRADHRHLSGFEFIDLLARGKSWRTIATSVSAAMVFYENPTDWLSQQVEKGIFWPADSDEKLYLGAMPYFAMGIVLGLLEGSNFLDSQREKVTPLHQALPATLATIVHCDNVIMEKASALVAVDSDFVAALLTAARNYVHGPKEFANKTERGQQVARFLNNVANRWQGDKTLTHFGDLILRTITVAITERLSTRELLCLMIGLWPST